jgi:hypothetical protein
MIEMKKYLRSLDGIEFYFCDGKQMFEEDYEWFVKKAIESLDRVDGNIGYCTSGNLLVVATKLDTRIDVYITEIKYYGEQEI